MAVARRRRRRCSRPSTAERPDGRARGRRARRPSPDDRRSRSVLAVAVVVVFCVSISVGDFPIPLGDVVPAIFGLGNEDADFIVRTAAAAAGAHRAARRRGVRPLRGDLPEPGPQPAGQPRHHRHHRRRRSAAAVFVIVVARRARTSMVVGRRARRRARSPPWRIYLLAWQARRVAATGWCWSASASAAMLGSVTSYLLTRAEIFDAQRATVWLTGSLNGRGWDHVRPARRSRWSCWSRRCWCWRGRCAPCSSATTPQGARRRPSSGRGSASLVVAVALAAVATAAAGPIAFVAFVAAADRPPAHRAPA